MSTLKEDLKTLKVPKKYQKAIAASISAAVPVVIFSLSDGHIDGGELSLIVAALLAPFGITFKVPNAKEEVKPVAKEAHEQLKLDL